MGVAWIGTACAVAASTSPASGVDGAEVLSIRAFGAVGDGTRLDTAAIQAAIDTCHARKGGTVVVPAGRYLTGTIVLKSHVTLSLSAAATLLGTTDLKQYATNVARCGFINESAIDKCLIYAEDAGTHGHHWPGHHRRARGGVPGRDRGWQTRRATHADAVFTAAGNVSLEGATLRSAGFVVLAFP